MKLDIRGHCYKSRKFLGLVFSFDCNRPQGYIDGHEILLIEMKLLFVGFWITFTKLKK